MGCRITKHTKGALHQVQEAALLALLTFRLQLVDRQHRRITGQGAIKQDGTVIGEPSAATELVGDTLGRLENRMEIIFSNKFGVAEFQHVGMDATGFQVGAKLTGASLGFTQCSSRTDVNV